MGKTFKNIILELKSIIYAFILTILCGLLIYAIVPIEKISTAFPLLFAIYSTLLASFAREAGENANE